MRIYRDIFNQIISLENLFSAWDEFRQDKRKRIDVLEFESNLEPNIFQLSRQLKTQTYKHGSYASFYIHDPKQRNINKAIVRDRVLHHAVFKILNPIFEPTFIANSFSCRPDKGTHKGVNILAKILRQLSQNNHKDCFILKCDIKKFFASVDHQILLSIIKRKIKDEKAIWLVTEIIESFSFLKYSEPKNKRGLPIGNLTSQLFANVYLNEFDQFIKHQLKIKYYLRYTDDFVIIANNRFYLKNLIYLINDFLKDKLKLELHPNKTFISKFHQGIDFLGYILFPHHRLVRNKTKKRMLKKLEIRFADYKNNKIDELTFKQSFQSYLGVLSHADCYELSQELKNQFWF